MQSKVLKKKNSRKRYFPFFHAARNFVRNSVVNYQDSPKKPDPLQNSKEQNHFDAIVIGSGIGGMTAAALLARLNKKRVLVLERHFKPGGMTHRFSRGRFEWDVGLHYVGRMRKKDLARIIFDYITNGNLQWGKMTGRFDQFVYPDLTFSESDDPRQYKRDLCDRFPAEKKAILRYFKDIRTVYRWFSRHFLTGFLPRPLRVLLRLINSATGSKALQTTERYLDRRFSDSQLKALLASQWGDYGAPPSESAFVMHAAIVNSFLYGGYFPEKQTGTIAGSIEKVIRQSGGQILVNHDAHEIILQNGKAVGVRVQEMSGLHKAEKIYYAPVIISNAGANATFNKLLPERHRSTKLNNLYRNEGYSAVTLFLGLKSSPEILGVSGQNVWINETLEHNNVELQTKKLIEGSPVRCFVSFPSLREKQKNNHTMQIITIASYDQFLKWKDQPWRKKDDEYRTLKESITDGLLNLAERHLPGLSGLIEYKELATPLTLKYFTKRVNGSVYGYFPDRERFKKTHIRVHCPVTGLYLSGTDACTMGITGALMGGVAAASAVNGWNGIIKIITAALLWKMLNKRDTGYGLTEEISGKPYHTPAPVPVAGRTEMMAPCPGKW